MNRHVVAVTVDQARGVALLKGWRAKELVLASGHKPLWSAVGRGWCIDAKHVPDVEAVGQLEHQLVIVRASSGGDGR